MQSSMADLTTLHVGGRIDTLLRPESRSELIDAVRSCDQRGIPIVIVGGGSNTVAADEPVSGTVIHVANQGITVSSDSCGGAWVEVGAGESWESLVQRAIVEEWVGIEALSGIPGYVGATPMQNVGAYGQEVAEVIARVETYDRVTGDLRTWAAGECEFGYRSSLFKRSQVESLRATDPLISQSRLRYVVLSVAFQFTTGNLGAPVTYGPLAKALGVDVGERVPSRWVREAVLELRRSKGMVLDSSDHDTWSVGSFFVNPIVPVHLLSNLTADAPRWETGADAVKLSAAWLVEQAGFTRGFCLTGRPQAALSTKHTLAITNRGGATAADVLTLAEAIQTGVWQQFGVWLTPEPAVLGRSDQLTR